jgi:T5SS/PEP-CTERM-associated repeat protein
MFCLFVSLCALLALPTRPAGAAITVGGDPGEVSPANPSTWKSDTFGEIGIYPGKSGTVGVDGGSHLISSYGILGDRIGSSGSVTITGPGSTWTTEEELYLGDYGAGSLTLANGGKITLGAGYIGRGPGSHGTIHITGSGSAWIGDSPSWLFLGEYGNGTLRVDHGGVISVVHGYVAVESTSGSTATITGSGSVWANSDDLTVGYCGVGVLTVGDRGKVTAPSLTINSSSVVNLHVSGDDMIELGSSAALGNIANAGKVNLSADAFLAAGIYSPFVEVSGSPWHLSGTGSYNAFGGTWDGGARTFTVAAATLGDAGVSCPVSSAERLLITDSASGRRVGASFGTVADGTSFTATPLSGASLGGLPADQPLLAAWNFSTNFTGDQALLAFDVGAGQTQDLAVWHSDGATWTPFDAFDLTYGDDGIASFAVTGFGSYAVTVPEPGSVALVLLAGLAVRRRRSPERAKSSSPGQRPG